MRLDTYLVTNHFLSSRQEAILAIEKGSVLVNGKPIYKKAFCITKDDSVQVSWKRPYVSRGGEKLEAFFMDVFDTKEKVRSFLTGATVLDIGSSTGGFTDFMLTHGALSSVCVDVGTNQLHTSLRNNPNVTLFEHTDIRAFDTTNLFDVIAADVSFINLETIIPAILRFCKKETSLFILIKPQFEVGRANLKKGVVKDTTLYTDILTKYQIIFEKSFNKVQVYPCRLLGGDGNQEFFIYATNTK